jgi:hypothetical protein
VYEITNGMFTGWKANNVIARNNMAANILSILPIIMRLMVFLGSEFPLPYI